MTLAVRVIALLLAVVLVAVQAAPAPPTAAQIDKCFASVRPALARMKVPLVLTEVIKALRAINPTLKKFGLVKMLDSAQAETDVLRLGIVDADQMSDSFEPACLDFIKKAIPLINKYCDINKFQQNDDIYMQYLEALQANPDIDAKIGAAKLCIES